MALTKLPGFTLDSTSSFTFANANVTANLSAGNILTNNLLYANGVAWNFAGTYSNANVDAYLPTYTGNISANYYTGNGSLLASITGANVTGQVGNALVAGTVYTSAQPNITSVGSLASLTVTGLVTATAGGIKVGNIQDPTGTNTIALSSGNVSVTGNITAGAGGSGNVTATYFIGNGSQLTGITGTYSNTNVAAYLPTYTGNFTAGNANISGSFTAANITTSGTSGNISGANVISANSFTATSTVNFVATSNVALGAVGNIKITGGSSGQYLRTDGTGNLTWADAGNATAIINGTSNVVVYNNGNVATSVSGNANVVIATGTGANVNGYLTVTGAFTAPNITTSGTSGNITGANYIIANYFQGNGSGLSSITGANVSGYVPLATSANTAGTVTVASQPNITSIGNLVNANIDGNLLVTGNLTVNGTTEYTNVTNLYVKDPIIEMGGGTNNAPLTTNDGKDRGTLLHYYTTQPVDAFMGWDNSNGEFAFGSNVTISSEVATFNTFGNVRAGNFIGTLSGAATTAGTVTTNAQPNITSVGTLASLSVTANITAGNINGGNAIVGNYFVGNGSLLTGLPASYSNTNVAAYLPTYTGNFNANNITSTTIDVSTTASVGQKYGSLYVDDTNGIILPGNGSGAWTLSFWLYLPTQSINYPRSLYYVIGGNDAFFINWNGSTTWALTYAKSGIGYATFTGLSGAPTQNTWHFVTLSYNGSGTLYGGWNGSVSSASMAVGSGTWIFGTNGSPSGFVNSFGPQYYADIAFVAGTASYTSNFSVPTTHPSPSAYRDLALAKTSGTYLVNSGTGGGSFTTYGSPTFSTLNPIAPTGTLTVYSSANLGNSATASYFIGNGSLLTSLTGSNVTGQVGNSLVAGTVYTAAQPNITSVGTLTSVNVSGNISSGGNVIGTHYGNGYNLSGLLGSNVLGQVGNALVAGTVYTAAQPNITSVGTLTTVSVSGNVSSGGNIIGNGQYLTSITGANVNGAVTFATTANSVAGGNVSGQVANALIAGTVYTNAQPNITSVGTLTSLSVTSNVSAGNILTDNLLYANGTAWSFGGTGSGNIAVDTFTGDGANTAFTLSVTPTSANNVIVNYNGAFVTHDSYSVAGATLTFGSAPATGSKVEVTTLQGVPSGGGGGASNARVIGYSLVFGG